VQMNLISKKMNYVRAFFRKASIPIVMLLFPPTYGRIGFRLYAYTHPDTGAEKPLPNENIASSKAEMAARAGASHIQEFSSASSEVANVSLQGREASSTPRTAPEFAPLVAKEHAGTFMWDFHDKCSSILAAAVVAIKLKPGIMDAKSANMLRSSSESLFLWGELFQPRDLDSLMEWSYDLNETIV